MVTVGRLVHRSNIMLGITETEFGSTTEVRAEQSRNMAAPSSVTEFGIVADWRVGQFPKAPSRMTRTESGTTTDRSPRQSANALTPIPMTTSGITANPFEHGTHNTVPRGTVPADNSRPNPRQLINELAKMEDTEFGIVADVRLEQKAKARSPTAVTPSGRSTRVRFVHCEKALTPIERSEVGKTIEARLLHSVKAKPSIDTSDVGRRIDVRPVRRAKRPVGIVVIEFGRLIDKGAGELANAKSLKTLMVGGIVTEVKLSQ